MGRENEIGLDYIEDMVGVITAEARRMADSRDEFRTAVRGTEDEEIDKLSGQAVQPHSR